jgi:hypothetical protein
VAVAAGAFWFCRAKSQSPTKLVHEVRLGQTRADVIAIMGTPPIRYRDAFCYGWSAPRLVETLYPPRHLIKLNGRYPVLICFDADGKVNLIECDSEGIQLRR